MVGGCLTLLYLLARGPPPLSLASCSILLLDVQGNGKWERWRRDATRKKGRERASEDAMHASSVLLYLARQKSWLFS